MEIHVLKDEGNELELEIYGDKTIPYLVKSYLVDDDRVDFVAIRTGHPLEGKVYLYLRAKEGSPRELLKSAVEKAKADLILFRTAFDELQKQ